jgi:diguanylate cyclase (GGDEF)-like protein
LVLPFSLSSSLDREAIFERSKFSPQTIIALLEATMAITGKLELEAVGRETSHHLLKFLDAQVCFVSRWDRKANTLKLCKGYDVQGEEITTDIEKRRGLDSYPHAMEVLRKLRPTQLQAGDPDLTEFERRLLNEMGACSLLLFHWPTRDDTIGLLEIVRQDEARVFTEEEIFPAQLIVSHGGMAVERAFLLSEAQQRADELEILQKVSLSVTASLNPESVLQAILENTLDLFDVALDAHIFLYERGELSFGAAMWADRRQAEPWAEPREDGLTYTVARSGETIVVNDLQKHPIFTDIDEEWKGAIIGLPLNYRERVVGVMNIAFPEPRKFSDSEINVLNMLVDQAAVAIENARLYKLVSEQALTDSLTELPNRRAFDQRLEEEIRRSRRYDHKFVLLMLDIDGFKRVNDSFWHPYGDRVLHQIGQVLQERVRDTDFAARYGGDEFAFILPETPIEAAETVTAKLQAAILEHEFGWPEGEGIPIAVSVGAAVFPTNGENAESLLCAADAALYRGKECK